MFDMLWLDLDNIAEVSRRTGITQESLMERYFSAGKDAYVAFTVINEEWLKYVIENLDDILKRLDMTFEQFKEELQKELNGESKRRKDVANGLFENAFEAPEIKLPALGEGVVYPTKTKNGIVFERRDIFKNLKAY